MDGSRVVFEVVPGSCVGEVQLGMSRNDVRRVMGEPERAYSDFWCWLGNCLQVFFDSAGSVGEIMLCAQGPVTARWNGIDLLDTPADEVVVAIASLGKGGYEESRYSYTVPSPVNLSFWRQCLPGDEPDDDPQFRGGRYWDTVSIGADSYYSEAAGRNEK